MQQQSESLTLAEITELNTRLADLCREYGFPVTTTPNYQVPITVYRPDGLTTTTIHLFYSTVERCDALFRMITDPRFDTLYPVDVSIGGLVDDFDADAAQVFVTGLRQCKAIRRLGLYMADEDDRVPVLYLQLLQPVLKHLKVSGLILGIDVSEDNELIVDEVVVTAVDECQTLNRLGLRPSISNDTLQSIAIWTETTPNRGLHMKLHLDLGPHQTAEFDRFDFSKIDTLYLTTVSPRKLRVDETFSLLDTIIQYGSQSKLRHLAFDTVYNHHLMEIVARAMRGLESLLLVSTGTSLHHVAPLLLSIQQCPRFKVLTVPFYDGEDGENDGGTTFGAAPHLLQAQDARILDAVRWHPTFERIVLPGGVPHPYYAYVNEVLQRNRDIRVRMTVRLAGVNQLPYPNFHPVFRAEPNYRQRRQELFFIDLLPPEIFRYILQYVGYNSPRLQRYIEERGRQEEEEED